MGTFDYKLLTEIRAITYPSCSLYVHTTPTASYVRSIVLHNTSGSTHTVELYKKKSGSLSPMDTKDSRIFYVSLDPNSTYMIEYIPPGLMLTGSYDSLWAKTNSTGSTINVVVIGASE